MGTGRRDAGHGLANNVGAQLASLSQEERMHKEPAGSAGASGIRLACREEALLLAATDQWQERGYAC